MYWANVQATLKQEENIYFCSLSDHGKFFFAPSLMKKSCFVLIYNLQANKNQVKQA